MLALHAVVGMGEKCQKIRSISGKAPGFDALLAIVRNSLGAAFS
jgi:hypothetical protein